MDTATEMNWSLIEHLINDHVVFQVDIAVVGLRKLNRLLEWQNDGIVEIHFLGLDGVVESPKD
jgi:hypothetical protein